MLSEYLTKASVIHFNSISVDFIDRSARNEQQGNQLDLNVSLVCQNSVLLSMLYQSHSVSITAAFTCSILY